MVELRKDWKELLFHSMSTKLSAVLGTLAGVVGSHEIISIGLLNFLPPGKPQLIGAAVVGFMVFAAPIIVARLTRQPKLEQRIEENGHTQTPTS